MNDKERFHFRIDALTPDTIPMVRLAQYLACLSEMYGNQEDLRFKGLVKGSAVLRVETAPDVAVLIRERLLRLNSTDADPALRRSYDSLNSLLAEDNAVATVRQPKGKNLLAFPGRKSVKKPDIITIAQHTTIDAVVVRIGGRDETIPVMVQNQEGQFINCTIRGKASAKELSAYYLGSPLRISGRGDWVRSECGQWSIERLNIQSFEEIDDAPLLEIFENLRNINGMGWKDVESPIEYWESIRSG